MSEMYRRHWASMRRVGNAHTKKVTRRLSNAVAWLCVLALMALFTACGTAAAPRDAKLAREHCDRGNALLEKQEYDGAIAEYSDAIHLDPKLAWAYFSRGVAWASKGDDQKAIANLNNAIRIEPDFKGAHFCSRQFALSEGRIR